MGSAEFLEYAVQNLVSEPERVNILEIPGGDETIIELRVDDADIGKVIGKGGSVARALRTVIGAIGLKENKSYNLEIID
jgi:hypothetical protein